MDYFTQQIAKRIKIQAKSRSVSIREMYSYLELPRGTVPAIAEGDKIPYQIILSIATYLDCSIDYLLGRTNNPKSHIEVNSNE